MAPNETAVPSWKQKQKNVLPKAILPWSSLWSPQTSSSGKVYLGRLAASPLICSARFLRRLVMPHSQSRPALVWLERLAHHHCQHQQVIWSSLTCQYYVICQVEFWFMWCPKSKKCCVHPPKPILIESLYHPLCKLDAILLNKIHTWQKIIIFSHRWLAQKLFGYRIENTEERAFSSILAPVKQTFPTNTFVKVWWKANF